MFSAPLTATNLLRTASPPPTPGPSRMDSPPPTPGPSRMASPPPPPPPPPTPGASSSMASPPPTPAPSRLDSLFRTPGPPLAPSSRPTLFPPLPPLFQKAKARKRSPRKSLTPKKRTYYFSTLYPGKCTRYFKYFLKFLFWK